LLLLLLLLLLLHRYPTLIALAKRAPSGRSGSVLPAGIMTRILHSL
jgi:hypothetical protein